MADPTADETGALPASVRRQRVLDTVRRQNFVSVTDLSSTFGVSEVTIRADLEALAEEGAVRRVRGGAIHRATVNREASFEEAADELAAEKRAIGRVAAAIVQSGQTVILDAGSTTAAVARALAARPDLADVTVFTNGIRIALELEPAVPGMTVIVTGGTLRPSQHSLVSPMGTVILDQIHAHVAFIGCDGLDVEAGATSTSVADAEIKRLMLRAGRRRVIVADRTKLAQVSLVHLVGLDDVDLLVTDTGADEAVLAQFRSHGLDIQLAG